MEEDRTMIVYPDYFPRPTLKDLKYEQEDNVLRTKMLSGYTRSRQISLDPVTVKQVIYRVHKNEASLFEAFIKYELKDASLSFLDLVHTPMGLIQHQIKFLSNPLASRKPISRLYWQYDAKVEIEDFATLDEDVFSLVMDMNITLNNAMSLLDALEDMLN
jgi:hypothetical protein